MAEMSAQFDTKTPSLPWPALAGLVLGCALQLQQGTLWAWPWYAAALLLGGAGLAIGVGAKGRALALGQGVIASRLWLLLLAALMGLGWAGWRADLFTAGALAAQLEGRDLRVLGMVSAMPQRSDSLR